MSAPPVSLVETLRDRYRVERELGRGGMAMVWLAQDLRHDRPVAIKVLRPELSAILGAERFLREIQLTAKLQHPHILPLLDSGEAQGVLYYVMPFVEGESLRQRLQRERQLSVEEALRITRGVAAALAYAHEQGVIHRDIKPENILLYRGEPMVADFGIALAAAAAGGERLTETGLSLGTPAYMSPEQAMAEPRLDSRTDQYSLACVLYEMLAGEPPYTGPTAQAIVAKRLSEPVPHVRTLREVPPAVDAAITRALARAPADRFDTTTAFAAALASTSADAGLRHPWLRRRRAAALAGVGALVAALGALVVMRRGQPRALALAAPAQRQFTFSAQASETAISPDGQVIAYVSGRRSLVREAVAGGGPIVLVRAEGWIAAPRWSPDGAWLYFSMLREATEPAAIYRIPSRGGAPVKIVEEIGAMDLSPDGRTLVRGRGDTLILHDVATGRVQARFPAGPSFPDDDLERLSPYVAWSPDGRWLASVCPRGDVRVISTSGRGGIVVARGRAGPVRWSPSGDALYYLSGVPGGSDLVRVEFDRGRGRAGVEQIALSGLPFLFYGFLGSEFDMARSAGVLTYVTGPQSHHVWAFRLDSGRDTATAQRLSADSRTYDWPAVSPDGGTLAVIQYDERGRGNFFVAPMNGGPFSRLTDDSGGKTNPSWAPDGAHLAYVLSDSGGSRLVLTDRTGERLQIGTTPPWPVSYFRVTWSADGHTALYAAHLAQALVALDISRGRETITTGPDSSGYLMGAVLSPDGREVIATVWLRPADGFRLWHGLIGRATWTALRPPAGDNLPLVWREDGWIYLYNDPTGADRMLASTEHPAIWRMRADGSRQELVAHLPAECRFGYVSMSGDARGVACSVLHREPDIWLVSNFDAGR